VLVVWRKSSSDEEVLVVWRKSGRMRKCWSLRRTSDFYMYLKEKHVDENNLDDIRLFNMDETGHSTIQYTQEILQILG
jgi:hypothetical protein